LPSSPHHQQFGCKRFHVKVQALKGTTVRPWLIAPTCERRLTGNGAPINACLCHDLRPSIGPPGVVSSYRYVHCAFPDLGRTRTVLQRVLDDSCRPLTSPTRHSTLQPHPSSSQLFGFNNRFPKPWQLSDTSPSRVIFSSLVSLPRCLAQALVIIISVSNHVCFHRPRYPAHRYTAKRRRWPLHVLIISLDKHRCS